MKEKEKKPKDRQASVRLAFKLSLAKRGLHEMTSMASSSAVIIALYNTTMGKEREKSRVVRAHTHVHRTSIYTQISQLFISSTSTS